MLPGAYSCETNSFGSDHTEQDRPNKSERGEDGYYVNPAGEIHVYVSPLVELAPRLPAGRSRGKRNISRKSKAAA